MERATDSDVKGFLATALATVAAKGEPTSAAKLLAAATGKVTAPQALTTLVSELAAIAERLKPAEAEKVLQPRGPNQSHLQLKRKLPPISLVPPLWT